MPLSESILKQIRNNTDGFITLENQGLFDDDVVELVLELKKKVLLIRLDLSNNNIREKGALELVSLSIQELGLYGNSIGDAGVISLMNNKSLRWLDVGYNNLSEISLINLYNNDALFYVNIDKNLKIGLENRQKFKKHYYDKSVGSATQSEQLKKPSVPTSESIMARNNIFSDKDHYELKQKSLADIPASSTIQIIDSKLKK